MTIQDACKVQLSDLSAQFYITEDDIGKNRAEACISKLQQLNNSVHVEAYQGAIDEKLLKRYQVPFELLSICLCKSRTLHDLLVLKCLIWARSSEKSMLDLMPLEIRMEGSKLGKETDRDTILHSMV